MSINTLTSSGAFSVDKVLGEAFFIVKAVQENLESIQIVADLLGGLDSAIDDLEQSRDSIFSDHIAVLVAGLNNYQVTLVGGIANYDVGEYFVSDETGSIRLYKRIAAPPYYEDQGDLLSQSIEKIVYRINNQTIGDIQGLQAILDAKAEADHGHNIGDVADLQNALDQRITYTGLAGPNVLHSGSIYRNIDANRMAIAYSYTVGDPKTQKSSFRFRSSDGAGGFREFVMNGDGDFIAPNTVKVNAGANSVWHDGNLNPALLATKVEVTTGLAGKASLVHNHVIGDVPGLQGVLDGKAALAHTHATGDIVGLDATLSGLQTQINGKAATVHGHIIDEITGLDAALSGLQTQIDGKQAAGSYVTTAAFTWSNLADKPATFAPTAHVHTIGDITDLGSTLSGLQTQIDGLQPAGSYVTTANFTWANLTGKPSTFTPSAHTHIFAEIPGLQAALDGKQAVGSYAALSHTHIVADVPGLQTALDSKVGRANTGVVFGIQPYKAALWIANGSDGAGIGGWARAFAVQAGENSTQGGFFSVGGGDATATQIRIGVGDIGNGYTQANALLITEYGVQWGTNPIWHTGNFDPASKADVSHTHNVIYSSTDDFSGGLQNWNILNRPDLNPNSDYWYGIRVGHGSADTYYSTTLAINFFSDDFKFRRKAGGVDQAWRTIWHDGIFDPSTKLNTSGGSISGDLTVAGGNIYIRENPAGAGAGIRLHHSGGGGYFDFDGALYFRTGDGGSLAAIQTDGRILANGFNAIEGISVGGQTAAGGYMQLSAGSAGTSGVPGYVSWSTGDGVRRGYMGWAEGSNIVYQAENGWGLKLNSAVTIGGLLTVNSSVISQRGSGTTASMNTYLSLQDNGGIERGWVGYGGEGNSRMRVNNSIGSVWVSGTDIQLVNNTAGSSTRIATTSGYLDIGPLNSGYCHYQTDRPAHYFNTHVEVNGNLTRYSLGAFLHHDSSSMASGKITTSTSAPSGGSDGDIWLKVS